MTNFKISYKNLDGEVSVINEKVLLGLVKGKARKFTTGKEFTKFVETCRNHKINVHRNEFCLVKDHAEKPAIQIISANLVQQIAMSHPKCEGWKSGIIVETSGYRRDISEKRKEKREGTIVHDGEKLLGGWAMSYPTGWKVPKLWEIPLPTYQENMRIFSKTVQEQAHVISTIALTQLLRELYLNTQCYLWSEIKK